MPAGVSSSSGGIFVSYRRQETAYAAGWLYQQLRDRFGRDRVFKDIDDIEPGDDFVQRIGDAVGSCAVLLAVIGDRWADVVGDGGLRRLEDPQDFVRLEIEQALQRGVRVVPLLISGARMPRPDQLPDSLAALARRQAVQLSPERFETDLQRLLVVLERTLAETGSVSTLEQPLEPEPEPEPEPQPEPELQPEPEPELRTEPVLQFVPEEPPAPRQAPEQILAPPESEVVPQRPVRMEARPAPRKAVPVSGARLPSGIAMWAAPLMVAAALVTVVASWPQPGAIAWKDTIETLWEIPRTWHDALIWAPLLSLAATAGAWRFRALLGAAAGLTAYVAITAATLLAGRITYGSTDRWTVTLLAALGGLAVAMAGWHPDAAVRRAVPPVAGLAVLAGAGLHLASQAVEQDGYKGTHTWLGVTDGFSSLSTLLLLVAAAPVLVDLGGRPARQVVRAGAGAVVMIAALDALLFAIAPAAVQPPPTRTVATIAGLRLAGLAASAAGIVLAAWRHDRDLTGTS